MFYFLTHYVHYDSLQKFIYVPHSTLCKISDSAPRSLHLVSFHPFQVPESHTSRYCLFRPHQRILLTKHPPWYQFQLT